MGTRFIAQNEILLLSFFSAMCNFLENVFQNNGKKNKEISWVFGR